MADYKDIIGLDVEVKAADPDNPSDGQVWFNTAGDLKYKKGVTGAVWSTGGTLNTARRFLAGCGTQTAALGFGGGPPVQDETEEYNGSSWSEQNNLNTARRELAGAGIQTAALAFGGAPGSTNNESYLSLIHI